MDRSELDRLVDEHLSLTRRAFDECAEHLIEAGRRLSGAIASGHKVLVFGNGGSASDAQHVAAELVGRFRRERRGLPAVALTTDGSILTSLANDFGFEQIFSRQLEALGRRGDVALGISTSGRSENVVRGLSRARELGMTTVALLGRDGGPAAAHADVAIVVPAQETPRIQEIHGMIGHVLCSIVDDAHEPGVDSAGV